LYKKEKPPAGVACFVGGGANKDKQTPTGGGVPGWPVTT